MLRFLSGKGKTERRNALIIFTREPVPGKTKTRLMPAFTPEQCAEFHKCFLKDISKEMKDLDADLFVAYTGGKPAFLRKTFRRAFRDGRAFEQLGDDFGERMENAFRKVLCLGYDKAVLIGTDIPELRAETIENAFDSLDDSEIVLGPTADGGYYLIGMKEVRHEAFDVRLYGIGTVFDETMESIRGAGLSVSQVKVYSDIDEAGDLAEFRERIVYDKELRRSETGRALTGDALISVIVPVYNEAGIIDSLTDQLKRCGDEAEIIFVDGGSTDDTLEKLERAAADAEESGTSFRIIKTEKGRGIQLNRGAMESSGDILFFLHCDCRLPDDFISEIRACTAEHPYGCFGLRFDSRNFFMLTNRLISNHRAWSRGLPFGDQGVFMDRKLFFDLGMYPDIPFMEDYEFALRTRRLGMRPARTRRRILSSGRRYGNGTLSIVQTELRMWNLRRLYRKGRSAEDLSSYYNDVR